MQRFAGARDEIDAGNRYVPLRMQEAKPHITSTSTEGARQEQNSQQRVGTWDELVKYPAAVLLSGGAGSGKTTLLLRVACQLAERAIVDKEAPVPIYLPLNTFAGDDVEALFSMIARGAGIEPRLCRELWRERHRPLCLLLDGVDEASAARRTSLVTAIEELCKAGPPSYHTVVLATRPGPVWTELTQSSIVFYCLEALPLRQADIDQILARYGAPEMARKVGLDPTVGGDSDP